MRYCVALSLSSSDVGEAAVELQHSCNAQHDASVAVAASWFSLPQCGNDRRRRRLEWLRRTSFPSRLAETITGRGENAGGVCCSKHK